MTEDRPPYDDDQGAASGSDARSGDSTFHGELIRVRQQLRSVRWKVFHQPRQNENWAHEYQRFHYLEREKTCETILDVEPWDLLILDEDFSYPAPTPSPKLLQQFCLMQADVPLEKMQHQFEKYINQVRPEYLNHPNGESVLKQDYQLKLLPKREALMLRFPNPEHMLKFSETLCAQQLVNMLAQELPYQFSRALQARYDHELHHHHELKPKPENKTQYGNEYTQALKNAYQQQYENKLRPKFRPNPIDNLKNNNHK